MSKGNEVATDSLLITTATDIVNTQLAGKVFYKSKTFWANIIALVGFGLQIKFGFITSPEIQTLALSIINLLLKLITKEQIIWTNE